MWSLRFWKDAAERAVRTAAQALLALWATSVSGILDVDWPQAASVAGLAAFTSVLMSLVGSGIGDTESASMRVGG